MQCSSCSKTIRYMRYSGMSGMSPHFYCDRCSNIIFRDCDLKLLYENEPSEELLERIASTLPNCPCGGQFAPGNNPKCPHCHTEHPHQHDPLARLSDPFVIKVEGADLLINPYGSLPPPE